MSFDPICPVLFASTVTLFSLYSLLLKEEKTATTGVSGSGSAVTMTVPVSVTVVTVP